jgi:hypothetical protein
MHSIEQYEFLLHFDEGFEDNDRLCSKMAQIALGSSGHSGLRVAVKPPLSPGRYTESSIDFLVLSAFFEGTSLSPIDWPLTVRVFAPLVKQPELRDCFESKELFMIGFGSLHLATTKQAP